MSLLCTIPQLYQELLNYDEGTEVRILGYVEYYNPEIACLKLVHPTTTIKNHIEEEQRHHSVLVDVGIITNDLDIGCTSYGEYIHVIGYIRRLRQQQHADDDGSIRIEAVTIWNAGKFDIQYWQRIMDLRSRELD